MNQATGEAVGILVFLLPGFVSIAVFHWLTPHRRPGVFGQIVQALMFTALAQTASWAAAAVLRSDWGAASTHWTEAYPLLLSVPFALFTGAAAAAVVNRDLVHRPLRRLGVTMETSYPSEWYAAFSAFTRRRGRNYVVLHLSGERRIYGWPAEWPSWPDEGHFRMLAYQWLTDEGVLTAAGDAAILIPVETVEMVEFIPDPNPKE